MSKDRPKVASSIAAGAPPRVFPAIVKFLTSESFRFQVLYKEIDTLTSEGNLTEAEALTLRTMDAAQIMALLKTELKDWGADIDKAFQLMNGLLSCADYNTSSESAARMQPKAMAAASMYAEGSIHVRCPKGQVVQPSSEPQSFDIMGHGFVRRPRIRFLHGSGQQVIVSPAQDATCSNDLFQHVEVAAILNLEGEWQVDGTNDPYADDFDTATQNRGTVVVTS